MDEKSGSIAEQKKKAMIEKVRKKALERWENLSFEEIQEARNRISAGMRALHRKKTPEERRQIAMKAAETRRKNQRKGGKDE